jgi:hypothetical protein
LCVGANNGKRLQGAGNTKADDVVQAYSRKERPANRLGKDSKRDDVMPLQLRSQESNLEGAKTNFKILFFSLGMIKPYKIEPNNIKQG